MRRAGWLAAILSLSPCAGSQAASALSYILTEAGRPAAQTVTIQSGLLWVKGAGGDPNVDLLFDRASQQGALIDHRRQRYTLVNEASVGKLASQLEDLTPLLQGLSSQLRRLNPPQREKWARLLDGMPLDALAKAQKELATARIEAAGQPQTIGGVRCTPKRLSVGKTADLEVCLAQPGALGLPADDAETLQALASFTLRLAQRARGLAARFGLVVASEDLDQLAGIPVRIKTLHGQRPLSLTLDQAKSVTASGQPPAIPDHYRAERLRLW